LGGLEIIQNPDVEGDGVRTEGHKGGVCRRQDREGMRKKSFRLQAKPLSIGVYCTFGSFFNVIPKKSPSSIKGGDEFAEK